MSEPFEPFEPPSAPLESAAASEPALAEYGRFEALPAEVPAAPPKTASRRTILIVSALVVLLLGVVATYFGLASGKGSANAHATIAVTQRPTAGLGTVVSSHGMTLTLPAGWTTLPTSPAELQTVMSKAAKTNPQMAQMLRQLAANPDAFKNFALMADHVDLVHGGEFLTVVAGPAARETADDVMRQSAVQLKAIGVTDIRQDKVDVPGYDAAVLHYNMTVHSASGTVTFPVTLYGVFGVETGAILTFSNSVNVADEQAIVGSVTFP